MKLDLKKALPEKGFTSDFMIEVLNLNSSSENLFVLATKKPLKMLQIGLPDSVQF